MRTMSELGREERVVVYRERERGEVGWVKLG
jgi:hypothetical protein